MLYRYFTRFLLERISWCCRDNKRSNGLIDLLFSNRANMSYDDLREYVTLLRDSADQPTKIDWNYIDPERIRTEPHSQMAGLQLADAIASAFYCRLEPNVYGNVERAYSDLLKPVVYSHKGRWSAYGLKGFPTPLDYP